MPMGIVSDEEFEAELGSSGSKKKSDAIPIAPINKPEIIESNKGRGIGNVEVPNALRNIIGEESAINGRESAIDLANRFGISPSSVSAYDVGATSTSSYASRPNSSVINQAKERISKRARGKLLKALNKITDEKLDFASAKDLSGIAKDMSAVVKSMEPEVEKGPTNNNTGPTFVFYAPQFRKEENYDLVHTKE